MAAIKKNKKIKNTKKWAQKQLDAQVNLLQKKMAGNEFFQLGFMAFLLILGLFLLYVLSLFLTADEKGIDYAIAQIIHTFITIFTAWISMRFFRIVAVQYYSTKTNKSVPRYIVTFFNWIMITGTIIYITVSILGQSAWSLVTAGGIIGAGLAFSLQGIVLDMVSGLILDVERTYLKGDSIRLDDGTSGKVMKTTWRHVEILTNSQSLIIIPNRMLTSGKFENLSSCNQIHAELIEISIKHTNQVERAERIMMGALLSIKEVVNTGDYGVFAKKISEGGVVFQVRFGLKGYENIPLIRHKVIKAIISHMHRSGVSTSKTLGEYTFSKSQPFEYEEDQPLEKILKKILLFKNLTDNEHIKLAKCAKKITLNTGEDLIVEGDHDNSLMVVAEGALDIIVSIKKGKTIGSQIVKSIVSPSMVGDKALLLGEKRSATVRAKTPILAYEITKEDFAPILNERPELVEKLSEIMIAHDLENSQNLKSLGTKKKKKETLKADLIKGIKKFFSL